MLIKENINKITDNIIMIDGKTEAKYQDKQDEKGTSGLDKGKIGCSQT